MPQITFDPMNANDVEFVREILDGWEDGPEDAPVSAVETSEGPFSLQDFLDNVGEGSFEFVRLGAQHFGPEEEFTFAELSAKSGIPERQLKAEHRNLARTAKMLGGHISDVIPARWDGTRNHYRIPPALHAAAKK